jgi:transposase
MGQRLNPVVVNKIQLWLDLGQTNTEIHKELKVSRSTVRRIRLNINLFGNPYAPPSIKLGHPRSLTLEQEEVSKRVFVVLSWY